MIIPRERYRWLRSYPAPTRSLLFLFLFLLGFQTIWHSQFYKHLSYRVYPTDIYITVNKSHSLSRLTQDKQPLLVQGDNRALDEVKNEMRYLTELRRSFMTDCNMTGLEARKLKETTGKDAATRGCRVLLETYRSILNVAVLKYFALHQNDTRDSFVNLHRYGYPIDSTTCKESQPDVVILVHSKYDHFNAREQLRATWASNRPPIDITVFVNQNLATAIADQSGDVFSRTVEGINFRTVFLLGQPDLLNMRVKHRNERVSNRRDKQVLNEKAFKVADAVKKVRVESVKFGDIVMGNFTDSYRNLTIKHIMALNWVVTHCPRVWYVAKVDDDVMVNIYVIAKFIGQISQSGKSKRETNKRKMNKRAQNKIIEDENEGPVKVELKKKSGLMACKISKGIQVQRKKGSKWHVSVSEYPFPVYVQWCLGYGVLVTRDVVQQLLQASHDVRSYWIDDVYVTGLLRAKAGLQITALHENHYKNPMFSLCNYIRNVTFVDYWKRLVAANEGQV